MVHPCIDATEDNLFGSFEPEAFYARHGVTYIEEMVQNARGLRQCTRSWIPVDRKPKGVVMVCHGYGADSGWLVQLTSIGFASQGFAVYAIDHQGHGKSEGLKCYIPDIKAIIDDCIEFFDAKRQNHKDLPAFLYGESLGGALALLIHLKQPGIWAGIVINGPMCGISAKFKPPWPAENLLHLIAGFIPTWPIVPTKDIAAVSFKEPWKRKLCVKNPHRYTGKPRMGTALVCIQTVKEIEARSSEVTAPLLIVHGELDVVTDPEGSRRLYETAASTDKTLRIYPGMWHQLIGEPPENVDKVFGEIYAWLDTHASQTS
ncbi:unnamed protein product [Sphagnum compactum]